MAASLASATVERAGSLTDVAVPRGTTVAGLLAMLHIDVSTGELRVTLANGRDADRASVIGADIPDGSLLAVTGERASARALREARERVPIPWLAATTVVPVTLLLVAAVSGVALVGPLTGLLPSTTAPARLLAAVLCAALLAALTARGDVTRSPIGLLALTAGAGTLPLAFITPLDTDQVALSVPLAAWAAFAVAAVGWSLTRSRPAAAVSAVWFALAVGASAVLALDVGASTWAPVALALAVLVLAAVPDMSVKVPESQLLDLPLVTTSAPTVRAPEVAAPTRVTGARVRRTLADASGVSDVLVVACCVLVPSTVPTLAGLADLTSWRGRGALGLAVLAACALAIVPRASRSHTARVLPRAAALLVVAGVLVGPAADALGGVVSVTPTLVCLATALVLATLASTREPRSAFIARLADVVQSASLVLMLPVAVLAAGLFDLIRQVAS